MRLLLDTHFLLWLCMADEGVRSRPISAEVASLIEDGASQLYFSAVSVWEVAVKHSLGKANFQADPYVFRRALLDRGYLEVPVTSEHGARVSELPKHHKDPFDRLLVAQAMVEGITLLTVDGVLARYPGPVRRV